MLAAQPVATVCLFQLGRLLEDRGMWVCRRLSGGPEYRNYWQGVGGKVEIGETPRMAAIRELMEEAGLEVGKAALSYQGHLEQIHHETGAPYRAHMFFIFLPAGIVPQRMEPDKAGEWEYRTVSQLRVEPMMPHIERALETISRDPTPVELPWERQDGNELAALIAAQEGKRQYK